jgi:hypothetical protein
MTVNMVFITSLLSPWYGGLVVLGKYVEYCRRKAVLHRDRIIRK